MKLVAILRVKDQISTIDECLAKLSTIADEIVVLDNGSTDGTLEAYKKYSKIVKILQTQGFDEGRDKIMLLEAAKQRNPDWILWTDADEIFERHFTREVAEEYMRSKYHRIVFRMCNFWLSKTECRYDHEYYLYTLHPQRSMWRNIPNAYFRNQKIHNGDIMGVPGKIHISPYRLKHYGYIDKEKIERKMKLYSEEDSNGSRDYARTADGQIRFKTFHFYEFDAASINLVYIMFYKYACNLLWLIERLRQKIVKSAKTT